MRAIDETVLNDLGIDVLFIKGKPIEVRNCWHFFSDGDKVDCMFYDEQDFRMGMNRVYITVQKYDIVILAFVLMDTHFHFVLYGDYQQCNEFAHDFMQRTSKYISVVHGDKHKLQFVTISHQVINTDMYLKTVICYVIKNPTMAKMPFMPMTYPWSSGPLYFIPKSQWCSSWWIRNPCDFSLLTSYDNRTARSILGSHEFENLPVRISDNVVFPGEYVPYDIVERIFGTHKSFLYFLSLNRDSEIEADGGAISYLTMPIQELRQQRDMIIKNLYGDATIRDLSVDKRLKVAKMLRNGYKSSPKQIAKTCCLLYEEVKTFL